MMPASVFRWLLVCFLSVATSEVVFGYIDVSESAWKYLGKFCYDAPRSDTSMSSLSYNVIPGNNSTVLLLYDDQVSSFPAAVQATSCSEKIYGAHGIPSYRVAIPLLQNIENIGTIDINEHTVPRWWYAVFASADCATSLAEIQYELTFLQPNGSQVSVQSQGMFGMYLFFFIVYLPGALLFVFLHRKGVHSHLLPSLVLWALLFQAVSVMLCMIHFAVYHANGVGVPFFFGLGQWLNECTVVVLLLLVLLVGSGFTARVWKERRLYVGIVTVYAIVDVILLAWYYSSFSSDWLTNFMYDSAAGIILMMLRLCVAAFFVYLMRTTYMMESQKHRRAFYQLFAVGAGMWLIIEPFLIFVADAVPSYYQEKMQLSTLVIFTAIFLGGLCFFLRPAAIKQIFPESQRDANAPLLDSTSLYISETPIEGYRPPPPPDATDDEECAGDSFSDTMRDSSASREFFSLSSHQQNSMSE